MSELLSANSLSFVPLDEIPGTLNKLAYREWQNEEFQSTRLPDADPERSVLQRFEDAMAALPPYIRAAVVDRFGLVDGQPQTYAQVGEAAGVSRKIASRRVRQGLQLLGLNSR